MLFQKKKISKFLCYCPNPAICNIHLKKKAILVLLLYNVVIIYIYFQRHSWSISDWNHNNTKLVVSRCSNFRPRCVIVDYGWRQAIVTCVRRLHLIWNILSYYGHRSQVSLINKSISIMCLKVIEIMKKPRVIGKICRGTERVNYYFVIMSFLHL